MLSQNLKTIVPALGLSKTALVFINQTRMKIGVMYGNPETTPGGMALSSTPRHGCGSPRRRCWAPRVRSTAFAVAFGW